MPDEATDLGAAVNSKNGHPWRWLSNHWVVAVVSILIALSIGWYNLDQGWFPHDEGQLGQAAERVYNGGLPHRDFDDMYTGGLSYLNALSFAIWGVNSHSMRWMLFVWFTPFVISVYWLAKRIMCTSENESQATGPNSLANWIPGMIAILASAWSIPIYSGAVSYTHLTLPTILLV